MKHLVLIYLTFLSQVSVSQISLVKKINSKTPFFQDQMKLIGGGNLLSFASFNPSSTLLYDLNFYKKINNEWLPYQVFSTGRRFLLDVSKGFYGDGKVLNTYRRDEIIGTYHMRFQDIEGKGYEVVDSFYIDEFSANKFDPEMGVSADGQRVCMGNFVTNTIIFYDWQLDHYEMSDHTITLPESDNMHFAHLKLTADGKFLATSNLNYNTERNKDIWFYEFVDNQWRLHSRIMDDRSSMYFGDGLGMNTVGDRIAISSWDTKDTKIISYKRLGSDWIPYGGDIIEKDSYIGASGIGRNSKFIQLSDDGKVMLVNYSYSEREEAYTQLYMLIDGKWQVMVIPDYDITNFRKYAISGMSSDGRTMVVGFQPYDSKGQSYLAIYALDRVSSTVDDQLISWAIYPNPVDDVLHIAGEGTTPYDYEIVHLNGMIHHTGDTVISRDIDVSQLAAGCYFIKITEGEHTEMHKFIKL